MSNNCKKSVCLAMVLAAFLAVSFPITGQAQMGPSGSTNRNMGTRTQLGNVSKGNGAGSGFVRNGNTMNTLNRPNANMTTGTRPSGNTGATGSRTMGAGSSGSVGRGRR